MAAYVKRYGDWFRRTGRRAGRPVGPWRSRRLDRQLARVISTTGWSPPEDPGTGGSAGVREPRRPRGPVRGLLAEADVPI